MGPHILAKFQFSSFTLTRSKTAVTERASHDQIHYLDSFFGQFFDGIELRSRLKNEELISQIL